MKLRQRRRLLLLPERGPVLAVLFLLMAGLLAACSSVGNSPDEPGQTPVLQESHPYLLTVDLQAGDAPDVVADLFGGEVIVWAEDDFAVLGFDSDPQSQEGFSTLGGGRRAVSEPNSEVSIDPDDLRMLGTSDLWAGGTSDLWAGGTSDLWAGGTSWLWAGGTSDLWAGGTSWLWAGGHFEMMPENTDTLARIGLDTAHGMFDEVMDGEVRVAVIDTGIDIEHPAFSDPGVLHLGPDYIDDGSPQEEGAYSEDAGYGHGTIVAGIVRQIAPLATIVPIRILDPSGRGDAANLAQAIVWAVDEGDVQVINVSLGGAAQVTAVEAAVDYAMKRGVFVVASTGDTGSMDVTFPAANAYRKPNALSVSSVDAQDRKSEFSPFHPIRVEMTAPGELIYGPIPEEMQAAGSGTSMAAPMVSGALALALAAEADGWQLRSPVPSFAQVLLATTDNIDSANDRLHRGKLGRGRLNVASFLEAVLTPSDDNGDADVPEGDERPGKGRGRGNDLDRGRDGDGPPKRADRRGPPVFDWAPDGWWGDRRGRPDEPRGRGR